MEHRRADLLGITIIAQHVDERRALPPCSGRGQPRRRAPWWAAIERAYALSEADLPAVSVSPTGPPPPRAWADKNPSAFARLEAAKAIVSEISESRGLPPENIVNPDLLRRLCWEPPIDQSAEGLADALRAAGARAWQADLLADSLAASWDDTDAGS